MERARSIHDLWHTNTYSIQGPTLPDEYDTVYEDGDDDQENEESQLIKRPVSQSAPVILLPFTSSSFWKYFKRPLIYSRTLPVFIGFVPGAHLR
jgi:hypothetical protein